MTAVISGAPETTEPSAPAAPAAASGRAPAGAFDLLIALLQAALPQAALPQAPLPSAPVVDGEVDPSIGRSPRAPSAGVDAAVRGNVVIAGHLALVDAPVERDAGDELLQSIGTDTPAVALPPALVLTLAPLPVPAPISPSAAEAPLPTLAPAVASPRTIGPEMMDMRPGARPALPPFADDAPPLASGVDHGAAVAAAASELSPELEPALSPGLAPALTSALASARAGLPRESGTSAVGDPRSALPRSARALGRGDAVDAATALETADAAQDFADDVSARATRGGEASGPQARVTRDASASTEAAAPDATITGPHGPAVSMTPRAALGDVERARSEPVRDPIDQIATRLRDVKGPGRHEISLRLDPPELGAVRIEARLEGARLQLQIRAEHAPTRELLADALPRLRESLAQQGFVPTDVSVQLGLDASGRQFTRDSVPMFTPPSDAEPSPPPRVVRAAARAVAASDGLDLWA